jgi:uncharacterized protein (TIGR02145 family)
MYQSNKNTMKYFMCLFLITSLFLSGCKKDEPSGTIEFDPPVSQITISGGQSDFNYGDTIYIDCQVTASINNLKQVKLFLDDKELYNTKQTAFTYEIYTNGLVAGGHTLKLSAWDYRDSVGSASKQVMVTAILPTILSGEILAVGTSSATLSGGLLSDGGSPSTWGLCYNKTGSPTKEENKIETTDTVFSIKLPGLQKLTPYYVRAWATNKIGTSYGKEFEFKTTDESGTFSDFRDDHEYRWVKIGGQVWMAENLAYLPFLSDPFNNPTTDSNIWVPGYEGLDVMEAKQTEYYKTYGALYSWKMANKYCPTGWHLPDTTEWNELIGFLGGKEIAGGKMKERGTAHWEAPNTGATNESGFTALPAGAFWPGNGGGIDQNYLAIFWHSTDSYKDGGSEDYNTDYQIGNKRTKIDLAGDHKKAAGFSVRCIKD